MPTDNSDINILQTEMLQDVQEMVPLDKNLANDKNGDL